MGSKRAANGASGKRRMGHIGFQSSEIAFIEDEMAAIAAEYGLEIDQDVAQHVHQRNDAKKARHRKKQPAAQSTSKYGPASTATEPSAKPSKRIVLHTLPSKFKHNAPLSDVNEHGEIYDLIRDVLPENGVVSKCGVPGCGCNHGGREMVFDSRTKKENQTMERVDALRSGVCKRCQHGVLQHSIMVREDGENAVTKPSGGQRLFSALYQLIRLARIAGTIYTSRVWSKSTTELLDALLLHVKQQFASGGTQNGQKTVGELQHEQQVLVELQSQMKKAEQAAGKSTRDQVPIHLACIYDQMYFHCYYASIVLYGRACGAVPAPEIYFSDLENFVPQAQPQLELFVNNELNDNEIPSTLIDSLALPLRENKKPTDPPALLEIYHARLREGVRLFYEQGVGMHGEMDALLVNPHLIASAQAAVASKSKKKPQKKHYRRERGKPADNVSISSSGGGGGGNDGGGPGTNNNGLVELPAYPLLAQWRNNCRDWCCHLYAYATPTPEALGVVGKLAPLVEMGAGTGYWSSLLQKQKVDIVAYDKCPPSTDGATTSSGTESSSVGGQRVSRKQERNAYHGQVPPFCPIGKGGPEVLKQDGEMAKRNLFLCYPPPHDDMALNCVRFFQGEHVIHVGEWQGDTGDRRFEKELEARFVLIKELALPNWGNSAYSLSIWKRKAQGKSGTTVNQVPCTALSCFKCEKSIQDAADEGDELKRCVLCKTNVYCSSLCEESDRKAHSAEHAKRLIFLGNEEELEFENELHYAPLINVAELNTEEADKVVKIQKSWKELTGGGDTENDNGSDDEDASDFDNEDDEAHDSEHDDSDMKDSDIDDESDEDDDEDQYMDEDEEEEEDEEESEEEEEKQLAPVKKARKAEPVAAAAKPKQAGFAFNFKA
ncbi:Clavaminate synthase [Globisporangium polare]